MQKHELVGSERAPLKRVFDVRRAPASASDAQRVFSIIFMGGGRTKRIIISPGGGVLNGWGVRRRAPLRDYYDSLISCSC